MSAPPVRFGPATPPDAEQPADAAADTLAPAASSLLPGEQLFLHRDLNEVLLLLDFISGRQDVHIWDIGDIKYPVRRHDSAQAPREGDAHQPGAVLASIDILRRICALRYPAADTRTIEDRADDAALLLCVKDRLNSIASPSSGVMIAYTYMFIEETAARTRREKREEEAWGLGESTRADVAKTAYPGLIRSAKRFRFFHRNVSRAGSAITFLAAILLWLVVYGVELTARFEYEQKHVTDVANQIYALADQENAALPPDLQSRASVPVRCKEKIDEQSNRIRTLCDQWIYHQARYEQAISDDASFEDTGLSSWLTMPSPVSHAQPDGKARRSIGSQESNESITLVLSAYASFVLPVMFGLVGTIASFLRDISSRITSSILAPRDETLAIIRLILGAIAGLAVGLFFTPASVAGQVSSGAGVLTLSASGIAFLAGYGADGFFRLIDAMIVRLFSFDRPDHRPASAK